MSMTGALQSSTSCHSAHDKGTMLNKLARKGTYLCNRCISGSSVIAVQHVSKNYTHRMTQCMATETVMARRR